MLCDERNRLLQQYALAIDRWFAALGSVHQSIGNIPQSDFEVVRASALQARDECQTRRQRLQSHRVAHGC